MIKKIVPIAMCALLIGSHLQAWDQEEAPQWSNLEAKSKKPPNKPIGPPGPPGPQGPPGNLVSNYAAAYGETQHLFSADTYLPIDLGFEQTAAVGVSHPVEGNLARFQVLNGGIFHLSWTLNAANTIDDVISISLYNVSNQSAVQPSPLGTTTIKGNAKQTISGQTIAAFPAGTTFEFQVCSEQGNAQIIPTITIIRIAQ